jgi:hypothetical protein
VGSLNQFVRVNIPTGIVTPVISNLNAPHGLAFVPIGGENAGDDQSGDR